MNTLRSALAVLMIGGSCCGMFAAASTAIPTALLEYCKEARKLGLKDDELKVNAVKAGWQPALVEQAIAGSRTVPPPAPPTTLNPAPPAPLADGPSGQVISRPDRGVADEYIIGAGDVLQVMVWKESEASVPSVTVRADGKIDVPLLKEVVVAGLTPAQAEQIITKRLESFIHGPDVTVIVKDVRSKKIYLIGAVKHEGTINLQYPMTILQALSEAGGVTDYAKRKKIYVLRTENGKQYRLPFNYDAALRGEQVELNIWVKPGDTIVVPH